VKQSRQTANFFSWAKLNLLPAKNKINLHNLKIGAIFAALK
jgi:hypothetical protein